MLLNSIKLVQRAGFQKAALQSAGLQQCKAHSMSSVANSGPQGSPGVCARCALYLWRVFALVLVDSLRRRTGETRAVGEMSNHTSPRAQHRAPFPVL
eukprot:1150565-Pelagomonas_calceolata.AAC.5